MDVRAVGRLPVLRAAQTGLARLNARHPWSHNDHFHPWILRRLPAHRERAVDVGCGRGELVERLAPRFTEVLGTDTDPGMRSAAAARTAHLGGVRITADELTDLEGPVDLITMVAVLHHLDVPSALREVRRLLAPGGRLLVVGLARPSSVPDALWDLASTVTNPLIGAVKHPRPVRGGPLPDPFPVAQPTLSVDELRQVLAEVLPGARLRRRLAFRHTVEWTRPPVPGEPVRRARRRSARPPSERTPRPPGDR